MSRSRMFDDQPPNEDRPETSSPRTTIVGGRPPEEKRELPPVPTGIQRLLRLASADGAFRTKLFEERDAVAESVGVELTPTERLVLRAASIAQLEAMARHLPPTPSPRRTFIRQSAAAAAALIGGPALIACESCNPTRGSRPDVPPARPTENEMQTTGGAAPDMPPPRPDQNPMQTEGGIAPHEPQPPPPPPYPPPGGARPDEPPPRPDTSQPTRGIRSDVPPESE